MKKELFFVLVAICLFTHICRTVYEILKHNNFLKPGKLSFVIMFTNMVLLWVSWFLLCRNDISRIEIPGIIRYAGLTLTGIGIIAFLTALFTIKTLESYEGDLITGGIYKWIRHPMYLGFICWLIGFPVYFGALYAFILALLFITNVLFWRYLEEKELLKRFPSYKDYIKTTFF
jgi:protein-S-isoprenylcysteine O-methyltransferase Ste14